MKFKRLFGGSDSSGDEWFIKTANTNSKKKPKIIRKRKMDANEKAQSENQPHKIKMQEMQIDLIENQNAASIDKVDEDSAQVRVIRQPNVNFFSVQNGN